MKKNKVFVQVFLKSKKEWVKSVNKNEINIDCDPMEIGKAKFDKFAIESIFINNLEVIIGG